MSNPARRRPSLRRPAETAGAGSSITLLIVYVLGITNPQAVVVLGALAAIVPAVVTFIVSNGGIRGVLRLLWRGRTRR